MKSLLNQVFEKVVCISLMERGDKMIVMEDKFNKLNIEVEWYRPVIHEYNKKLITKLSDTNISHFNLSQPQEIGASTSHYHVIKTALLQGVEKLFVFEDDLNFIIDFEEKLKRSFDKLPEKWDMIMFYSFMYRYETQNIRLNNKWLKCYNSWSLTSYGMNTNMMKEYIKAQDNYFTIADKVTYDLQKREELNILCSTPPLVIPNTKLSSNIRQELNYKTTPSILTLGIDENNYN